MDLAYRGDGTARPEGIPLPPRIPPMLRGLRLRKHWRYVGVWSESVSICAARVGVGPVQQEFWGVWDRSGRRLTEHTRLLAGRVHMGDDRVVVADSGHQLDLQLEEDAATAVEVVTPVRRAWTWTRKQAVRARGTAVVHGRTIPIDGMALIDDNDGYHPRLTHWRWSGGAATLADGRTATWNAITGLNDTLPHIENTLWLDGVPQPIGPVRFANDLSAVEFADGHTLFFTEEAERASNVDLLVLRSAYRQPFGTFSGALPGGLVVQNGFGVMEDHRALW